MTRSESDQARPAAARSPGNPARALAAAAALQKAGRLEEAAVAYRRILAAHPGQPDALHLLGLIARQQGRHEAALQLIGRAIAAEGRTALYHNNLGSVLIDLGRLEEARDAFQRALALEPRYVKALCNLGRMQQVLGAHGAALAAYRQALALQPRDPEIHRLLGGVLRDPEQALAHLQQAVALAPGSSAAHYALGNALKAQGRTARAAACYRRAVAADPGHLGAHNNLAVALKDLDDLEGAERAFRQALEVVPDNAQVLTNLGNTLQDLRRFDEAETCHRKAIASDPAFADSHNNLGWLLEALGRFEEARAAFEAAIAHEPDHVRAHANLASLEKVAPGNPVVGRIERLLGEAALPAEDENQLRFALGKCLDDLGDTDRAFAEFHAANELRGGATAFDEEAWEQDVERLIRSFPAGFFVLRATLGSPSRRPLFVLGMPRSGTSLVEQMLCRHPEIAGAGELPDLSLMARNLPQTLGAADPYPECVALIGPGSAEGLVARYLGRLDQIAPGAARVVDKMPNNFLRLGLIGLLFPRAEIIHCRRDPVDLCLSCYCQNFKEGHAYSHDLATLGRYYRGYERLMAHWQDVLPNPIFELSYERLVAEPEPSIREMIAFCGLDWEDACLDHRPGALPVVTASVWQVRQPVYRSSLGRWKRYEKHLGPLLEALGGD